LAVVDLLSTVRAHEVWKKSASAEGGPSVMTLGQLAGFISSTVLVESSALSWPLVSGGQCAHVSSATSAELPIGTALLWLTRAGETRFRCKRSDHAESVSAGVPA
jgi:hypothetical protein